MDKSSVQIIIDKEVMLRTIEESDAAALYELVEQNRQYLRAWLPWLDVTRSIEDERAFIRTARAQQKQGMGFTCVIRYKGAVAGTIGYHPIDWADRKVEIGYWLGQQYTGKGLMTKACRAMILYAFGELQLNKVEIRCATENMPSRAIPERLGFVQEGTIRQGEWLYDHYVDLVLYGKLASEWRD